MKLYDGMLCPICEIGYMKQNNYYNYYCLSKDPEGILRETKVENCTVFRCNICREGLFDDITEKRIYKEFERIRNEIS